MTQQIENIKNVRKYLLNLIAGLSTEQLNKTPDGFSNNIIWNLAHLTATQQRICYVRSGLQPVMQDQYITPFIPGTKPEGFIDAAEIETIKSLFISTVEELETDYKKNFFTAYEEITVRYGITLTNVDDAINFLLYHEGYHTGVIVELTKFV